MVLAFLECGGWGNLGVISPMRAGGERLFTGWRERGGGRLRVQATVILAENPFERGQTKAYFLKERRVVRHENKMGVLGPEGAQPGVEFDRFFLRLSADAVSSFDGSPSDSGGFEENYDLVAQKFFLQGGADGLEVTGRGAGPVGGAIDSAAVAQ